MMNRAVFLDRDGTLNYDSKDYVKSVEEFKIFKNTPAAIRKLTDAGFLIIVITNQSGISRGYFSEEELERMHQKLRQKVDEAGGRIDAIYYCPHHPDDNCNCRKPGPENINKAAKRFDINLANSYFIGDSKKDIVAGKKAGCKTVLVKTGIKDYSEKAIQNWEIQPDSIFSDILGAAKMITGQHSEDGDL
ncbi:MAG TPA: D-glycero-beta-D-manno-heptose 1,7-bisphosphate 7-phosphatase [bacterium]|nr:D-glycero-beta-D-manno-heptose 1,7-bisphosphate 7-phosphatase [bacterium]